MWEDPIVKETRDLRKKYASEFKNNPDAIFDDILKTTETFKTNMHFFSRTETQIRKKCCLIRLCLGFPFC